MVLCSRNLTCDQICISYRPSKRKISTTEPLTPDGQWTNINGRIFFHCKSICHKNKNSLLSLQEIQLTNVWIAGESRPCQITAVGRDDGGLQQTRSWQSCNGITCIERNIYIRLSIIKKQISMFNSKLS